MDADERKRQDWKRRREYILDRAEPLVWERGFDATTIDDMAQAAGYTKRSIYLYFKDRDEVFLALAHRAQKSLLAEMRRTVGAGEPAGAIRRFAYAFRDFSQAQPGYFQIFMKYESSRHDYVGGRLPGDSPAALCQNLSIEIGETLTAAIVRETEEGRLRPGLDPRQTMLMFWGQVFGVMQILLMRRDGFRKVYGIDQDDFFERFLESLERAWMP